MKQLSIFDIMPETQQEPEVGAIVEETGAIICHIMRPGYIGQKVLYDCSTQSRRMFKCGILEKYIPYEGRYRSIIYTGTKQRTLLTHFPGREIYEPLPLDAYIERRQAIGKRAKDENRIDRR